MGGKGLRATCLRSPAVRGRVCLGVPLLAKLPLAPIFQRQRWCWWNVRARESLPREAVGATGFRQR